MPYAKKQYPQELKDSAVARLMAGETPAEVGGDIGVDKALVGKWRRERYGIVRAMKKNKVTVPATPSHNPSSSEILFLRQENEALKALLAVYLRKQ